MAASAVGAKEGPRPVSVATAQAAAPALAKFSIQHERGTTAIEIAEHLWAPGAFVSLARELMGADRDGTAPATDGALRLALTRPTPAVIQAENVRLSRQLRERPRAAVLHEQAALLIGALALRENASILSDPRRMMSRMTAHLAIARALGSGDSTYETIDGALAEAVLTALANRQVDALARIAALSARERSAAIEAWGRALRVRVTKDWRLVTHIQTATLLEQREAVRASHVSVGDNRSLTLLDATGEPAELSDWGRALFHESPSVETGNRFAQSSVSLELLEAMTIRESFPDPVDATDADAVIRALNEEPQTGPARFDADRQFWIVDWGTWAAASQRHLAAGIVCSSRHLRKKLGLPEEAVEFDRRSRESFARLRLYPLVAREIAIDVADAAAYTTAATAAGELTRTRPDLITDDVWRSFFEKQTVAAVPAGLRAPATWFAPFFPAGTGFDARRIYTVGFHVRVDAAELERLRTLAPYERDFVLRWADLKVGAHPTVEALQPAIGALADYDSRAAWKVARAGLGRPDFYIPYVTRIAETMSPDDYYWVAEYLADYGRNDEAFDAFGHYHRSARNRVSVANRTKVFVVPLYRAGQRARALDLAKDAADVYSFSGLLSYAIVLDMSGEPTRAEKVYRQAVERYAAGSGDLLAFLMRHQAGNAAYAAEVRRLVAQVFPKGLERASAATLQGPPDAGLRISVAGVLGERAGLHVNDVIVAVDGVRVRDLDQYAALKFQSWAPPMQFTVWRDGRYVDVATTLRHGWMYNTLRIYSPAARAD